MGRAPRQQYPIMYYFPSHLKARDVQKNCLLEIEKNWDRADVMVVNLPVASGKSAIAMTVARWAGKASVTTPNKLLVNQYKQEYPIIHVMRGKGDYWCDTLQVPVNKRPNSKKLPKLCPSYMGCTGCTNYFSDLKKARVLPFLLANYYSYMALKLYRPVLIADEAHQLIGTLKNMARKHLWWHHYKFPTTMETRDEIRRWVNSLKPEQFNYHYNKEEERVWTAEDGGEHMLHLLKEELNSPFPKFLVGIDIDKYRDEEEHRIYMEPIDISDAPPYLWPNQVDKIILLSATISKKDIEQMGLSHKKVIYIEADSPINAEKRPVLLPKEAVSMAYKDQEKNMDSLINYIINTAAENPDTKGLIHATYGLAEKLRKAIISRGELSDRFIWHDKENKMEQYKYFRETDQAKILVASGMYEGIDLPYDAGRWQIIAKVPFPSLAEPAIKYIAEVDRDYYAWETIKTVLQACGRICRTPEDYGITYIADSGFKRLYNQNPQFFPLWFRNSVTIE